MKIKAALIDLNNTICNTAEVEKEARTNMLNLFADLTEGKYSFETSESLYTEAEQYISNAVKGRDATYDTSLVLLQMLEKLDLRSDKYEVLFKLQETYYNFFMKNIKIYQDAEEFLHWLKKSGRKVAIISDGSIKLKIEQIHELGIGKYIDYLVTSEESGSNKPAPNSYMLALHKLRVRPEEAFVIGSSSALDIYGGNMLGMISVKADLKKVDTEKKDQDTVYNSDLCKPRYTVNSLSKVKDIIEFIENNGDIE